MYFGAVTTALITGITGFVGRHLAARLIESGQRVAGFDRWPSFPLQGIAYRQLDIMDVDAIAAYRRALESDPRNPDAHYNLARLLEQDGKPDLAVRHLLLYRQLTKKR